MKNWKVYASFAAVAAVLPIVLAGAIMPGRLSLGSSAKTPGSLRLWLTPAEVIMNTGQSVKLKVTAEYEDPNRAIPGLTALVKAPEGVGLTNPGIKFQQAFTGVATVGEVTVTANFPGEYLIEIPVNEVTTGIPEVPVISSGAKITVK